MKKIVVDMLIAKEERRLAKIAKKKKDAEGVANRVYKILWDNREKEPNEFGVISTYQRPLGDASDISFSIYKTPESKRVDFRVTIIAYVAEQAPVIFKEFAEIAISLRVLVTVSNGGRTSREKIFGPKGEK